MAGLPNFAGVMPPFSTLKQCNVLHNHKPYQEDSPVRSCHLGHNREDLICLRNCVHHWEGKLNTGLQESRKPDEFVQAILCNVATLIVQETVSHGRHS